MQLEEDWIRMQLHYEMTCENPSVREPMDRRSDSALEASEAWQAGKPAEAERHADQAVEHSIRCLLQVCRAICGQLIVDARESIERCESDTSQDVELANHEEARNRYEEARNRHRQLTELTTREAIAMADDIGLLYKQAMEFAEQAFCTDVP